MTSSSAWRLSPSQVGEGRCKLLSALLAFVMTAMLALALLPASAQAVTEQVVEVNAPAAVTVHEGDGIDTVMNSLPRWTDGEGSTGTGDDFIFAYNVYLYYDTNYVKERLTFDANDKLADVVPSDEESAVVTIDATITGSRCPSQSYKAGRYVYDGSETTTVPVTVTVKRQKCTVAFDTAKTPAEQTSRTQVEWGSTVSAPATPTWEGHTFDGWYLKDSDTLFDFKNTAVKGDVTLVAKWTTHAYEVQFNENGADDKVASQEVEWGTYVEEPTEPVRPGKNFLGWYTADDVKWDFGAMTVTGAVTLTAKWQAQKICEVVVDPCNGDEQQRYKVESGDLLTDLKTPMRAGYEFAGWYSAFATQWDPETPILDDLNIEGKWVLKTPTTFTDVVSGSWYEDYVYQAADLGLMTGYRDGFGVYTGYFGPEDGLTRGQVATVLWRISGCPVTVEEAEFSADDVSPDAYYYNAVNWCAENGIVTGYVGGSKDGRFCPDDMVTRAQLATMIYRFAYYMGINTLNVPTANFDKCTDTDTVEEWSVNAMKWCAAAEVLTGKDTAEGLRLDAQQGATRAQAAKVFCKLAEILLNDRDPYVPDTDASDPDDSAVDTMTFDAVSDGDPVEQAEFVDDVTFDDVEFDQAA